MQSLQTRAESMNKASLEIEQQKDALAKEIEEMQATRAVTRAASRRASRWRRAAGSSLRACAFTMAR